MEKTALAGWAAPTRGFSRRVRLGQREPRMIEKGSAGGSQFRAARTPDQQLNTDLVLKIADLATEGRLRRMQPFLGGKRQAAGLGNGDEVAKVPQFHSA
jgi:hypothetical protein